jgi:hypothetical protein
MMGEREVSVFDELAKLVDSRMPTWQAVVTGAADGDIVALFDLVQGANLGVDDWSGIQVMCADCSHGNADTGHNHERVRSDQSVIGLAGSGSDLHRCLDEWTKLRPTVRFELENIWP